MKLAIEGGCNAVASTFGVLGRGRAQVRAQDPVPRQDQPQRAADLPEQVRPDHVRHASSRPGTWARRPSARRSTSARRESHRQIVEVAEAFARGARAGHGHGPLVLPAQHRLQDRRTRTTTSSADLTGQANHLGVTIAGRHHQAEAAREQRRLHGAEHRRVSYGKLDKRIYAELTTDHPIDLCRYQVANCYMGRAGLINSGGAVGRERPRRGRARPPSSTSAPAAWA